MPRTCCAARFCALAFTFTVSSLPSFVIAADGRTTPPSLAAVTSGLQSLGGGGPDGYATGFEPPQFLPASILGQQGWTCTPAAVVSSLITPFHPDVGQQHLRLIDNPGVPNDSLSAVLSPNLAPQTDASISVRYSIDNVTPGPDGGGSYQLVPQSNATGLVVTRMLLLFTGDIFVLDVIGGDLVFVQTGTQWVAGPDYHSLEVVMSNGVLEYFHDDALIYTGEGGLFGATSMDQVAIVRDNFLLPDETGDFDEFTVRALPEPTGVASVALVGVVAASTRRRRRAAL